MEIFWTGQAKSRLKECYQFYKKNASKEIADKIRVEVQKKPEILVKHPNAGQEEETLKVLNKGHRYLLVLHFKIVYRIENMYIFITDFFDTRKDPQKLIQSNE